MQDKMKLLNERNQRLNDLYYKLYTNGTAENRNLQNRVMSLQSTLDQCQSNNQDAVISRKELELCRDELNDELIVNNSLQNQLASKTAENENFKAQLMAKEAENDDLRSRIRRLESDKAKLQSLNERNQKLNDLYTNSIEWNRNLQNRVESLQSTLDKCQSDNQDAAENENYKTLSEFSRNLTAISK